MNKKCFDPFRQPRRHGNSDILCDEFGCGALDAGNSVEKIFVRDKKIGYCDACYGCGKCTQICPQNINIPGATKDFTEKPGALPSWAEICRQQEAAANKK